MKQLSVFISTLSNKYSLRKKESVGAGMGGGIPGRSPSGYPGPK